MNFFETLKEYERMTPGLGRIKEFFESIGNPQDKVKTVHIAGTNGKGSTAVFMSEILKLGGYKTALYISPHLVEITERIKINDRIYLHKFLIIWRKNILRKRLSINFLILNI
ncbi:MAG: hypothetical protein LBQ13_00250 [Endomicrobium sp.]|jgi:dihydrofolate synthase/folylpolyglutamate synthase|nr:hypothetical protein [Endomicrobium sp.]